MRKMTNAAPDGIVRRGDAAAPFGRRKRTARAGVGARPRGPSLAGDAASVLESAP